ncbi:hypothetical protein Pan216_03540 [Planctomycetes bacterium Pan216]|uniref:Uncharacterized protein n=1 Tax=Kolteria novifilia TaxID=2527975 RepID=A0A518AXS4_9BACT|nr:hypothetical protein Pan216_03540 [Planctomycetes bacterium Pan216]
MPPVIERAHEDLAHGELWRARERLEGYVGSVGYHRQVIDLLGEVCWRMGDVPAAGRYWFFALADSDERRIAIETFVRQCKGDPLQVLAGLPRRLRNSRWHKYPVEVQQRLGRLTQPGLERAPRKPANRERRPTSRPRSKAADGIAFVIVIGVALFFLYCFSLGLAELMRDVDPAKRASRHHAVSDLALSARAWWSSRDEATPFLRREPSITFAM